MPTDRITVSNGRRLMAVTYTMYANVIVVTAFTASDIMIHLEVCLQCNWVLASPTWHAASFRGEIFSKWQQSWLHTCMDFTRPNRTQSTILFRLIFSLQLQQNAYGISLPFSSCMHHGQPKTLIACATIRPTLSLIDPCICYFERLNLELLITLTIVILDYFKGFCI